jgi:protein-tyrosine phosphatase
MFACFVPSLSYAFLFCFGFCPHPLPLPLPGCCVLAGQKIAQEIWDFADAAHAANRPLLFLCTAGWNRSPTALMSWLIARRGFTFKRARAAVQRAREMSSPWVCSLQHLRHLEYEVHGT